MLFDGLCFWNLMPNVKLISPGLIQLFPVWVAWFQRRKCTGPGMWGPNQSPHVWAFISHDSDPGWMSHNSQNQPKSLCVHSWPTWIKPMFHFLVMWMYFWWFPFWRNRVCVVWYCSACRGFVSVNIWQLKNCRGVHFAFPPHFLQILLRSFHIVVHFPIFFCFWCIFIVIYPILRVFRTLFLHFEILDFWNSFSFHNSLQFL